MTLKEKIEDRLKSFKTPGSIHDVIEKNVVKEIQVDQKGKVAFKFHPVSSVCPMAFKLAADIKKTVEQIEGVTDVNIDIIDYNRADELMRLLNKTKN